VVFTPEPLVGVSALVQSEQGLIALVKRLKEPYAGRWAFPGGLINYGEETVKAVVREVKEETGLDVVLEGLLGVYDIIRLEGPVRYHYVTVCFKARSLNLDIRPGSDAEEAKWFKAEEIKPGMVTQTTLKALRDAGVLR